jgi:toxin ParE1/3/4
MPGFRLTKAAQADLRGIGRYTRKRWGRAQAHRYLGELDACFHQLAEKPNLGRAYSDLSPYWRILRGKHAVFYRVTDEALLVVVRVLHAQMLPELHLPGSEDDANE